LRQFATKLAVVALAASLTLALAGRGLSHPTTASASSTSRTAGGPAPRTSSKKTLTIAWLNAINANGYQQGITKGIEAAAAQDGIHVRAFDGELDAATQAAQIQDANTQGGYAGYIITPVSNAVLPEVKAAIAKKVPVVTVNTVLGPDPGSGAVQVPGLAAGVQTPWDEDGQNLAELTIQACAKKHPCHVALIVGPTQIPSETADVDTLKKTLAAQSTIDVVQTAIGDLTRPGGLTAAQDILSANPHVDVITTTGDNMALGAQQAIDQRGLKGVALIGDGASTQGVAAVKSGTWFGTTVQLATSSGQLAMRALFAAIHGAAPGKSINPLTASSIGRAIGPIVTKATLAKDPSFLGQWTG
jgi:ABC-type sugar transport system substrate-binding protein